MIEIDKSEHARFKQRFEELSQVLRKLEDQRETVLRRHPLPTPEEEYQMWHEVYT